MRARCALGWLSHGEHGHGASADSSGGGRSCRPSSAGRTKHPRALNRKYKFLFRSGLGVKWLKSRDRCALVGLANIGSFKWERLR